MYSRTRGILDHPYWKLWRVLAFQLTCSIRKIIFIKLPKICLFLLCLPVLGQNMFISERSQSPQKSGKNRFRMILTPSKMSMHVSISQKRPNATKYINFGKFYEHLSWIKNIKIPLLIFFFTFTLLSYIEINIDFRQTALGCHSWPLGGVQKSKKIYFVIFRPIEQ